MKQPFTCLVFALLVAVMRARASADNMEAIIKTQAEEWAKAVLTGDFEGTVRFTPARVVAFMGGKKAMLATLKRTDAEMKAAGLTIEKATVDVPEKAQRVGAWLTSQVTTLMVARTRGGHVTQYGALLGISEDEGKTWVFLSLENKTEAQLAKDFPELAGKITLPAIRKPVFTKDP